MYSTTLHRKVTSILKHPDILFILLEEEDQQRATSYFAHQSLQPPDRRFWALKLPNKTSKYSEFSHSELSWASADSNAQPGKAKRGNDFLTSYQWQLLGGTTRPTAYLTPPIPALFVTLAWLYP